MKTYTTVTDKALVDDLRSGKVGVLPSDTIYGLACRAVDVQAVERLYKLKHREHKPGTLIAASIDQLVELGLKRRYLTAIAEYWPGAVSVVIPCGQDLGHLHQGLQTLAVRIPDVPQLIELLEQTGPLITTSANAPGEPAANNLQEAMVYFGDKVDFYVEGGDLSGRLPSTLVRVQDDALEVIRQGSVLID